MPSQIVKRDARNIREDDQMEEVIRDSDTFPYLVKSTDLNMLPFTVEVS